MIQPSTAWQRRRRLMFGHRLWPFWSHTPCKLCSLVKSHELWIQRAMWATRLGVGCRCTRTTCVLNTAGHKAEKQSMNAHYSQFLMIHTKARLHMVHWQFIISIWDAIWRANACQVSVLLEKNHLDETLCPLFLARSLAAIRIVHSTVDSRCDRNIKKFQSIINIAA